MTVEPQSRERAEVLYTLTCFSSPEHEANESSKEDESSNEGSHKPIRCFLLCWRKRGSQ